MWTTHHSTFTETDLASRENLILLFSLPREVEDQESGWFEVHLISAPWPSCCRPRPLTGSSQHETVNRETRRGVMQSKFWSERDLITRHLVSARQHKLQGAHLCRDLRIEWVRRREIIPGSGGRVRRLPWETGQHEGHEGGEDRAGGGGRLDPGLTGDIQQMPSSDLSLSDETLIDQNVRILFPHWKFIGIFLFFSHKNSWMWIPSWCFHCRRPVWWCLRI